MSVLVHDNLFSATILANVCAEWPSADWSGWHKYDPAQQCKMASDLTTAIPLTCSLMLGRIAALPVATWFPGVSNLVPDMSLHGAGLYDMSPGRGLARHLDADTHKRLGLRRVLSAVLSVHTEWHPEWFGELMFESGIEISPMPGRLVVFDCQSAWHSVNVVRCPAGYSRKSLAMFWYAVEPGNGKRLRAEFNDDAV